MRPTRAPHARARAARQFFTVTIHKPDEGSPVGLKYDEDEDAKATARRACTTCCALIICLGVTFPITILILILRVTTRILGS